MFDFINCQLAINNKNEIFILNSVKLQLKILRLKILLLVMYINQWQHLIEL